MAELSALRGLAAEARAAAAKSVIFVFLTGGLSHQDSFDLKPDAPDTSAASSSRSPRGRPASQICEHLPLLAQRSEQLRPGPLVATDSNGHEVACHMLLTGRLDLPAGFSTAERAQPQRMAVDAGPGELTLGRPRPQQPAAGGRAAAAERQRGRPGPAGPVRRPARAALGSLAPAHGRRSARWATAPARTASASRARRFEHEPPTDLRDADADAARRRRATGCTAGSACCERSNGSSATWSGPPRAEQLDRHRQQALAVLDRPAGRGRPSTSRRPTRRRWSATARTSSACRC